jgi:transposase
MENNGNLVGIDWGVSKFATDSNGGYIKFKEFVNYKRYIYLYNKLKLLQSKLSKKRNSNKEWKSSKRYTKLKFKVKYLYERR